VAVVSRARRELLLRAYRYRLRPEDLEDCYSQATLELVTYARERMTFASTAHLANVLEQRFVSRIQDRRRAIAGRSPMQSALEAALPLNCLGEQEVDVIDLRAGLEQIVLLREDLRRIGDLASLLSADQRLVLASQVGQIGRSAFCARHGWSHEKYRKVAQRARTRLSQLMNDGDADVPFSERMSEEEIGTAYDRTKTNT
jgi:DNA-directed RNA polymerase specialized sigma24 family protein